MSVEYISQASKVPTPRDIGTITIEIAAERKSSKIIEEDFTHLSGH